jgi:hypothetical protein
MNVTFENFIGIYKDAFSKAYCDRVIKFFEEAQQSGLTLTRQQLDLNLRKLDKDDSQIIGHDETNLVHTAHLAKEFTDIFWGVLYQEYANKYDILKTLASHSMYSYKVQKTEVGQGYHMWHPEVGDRTSSARILAWTLYLNDVKEGGETEFIYYPKRLKPTMGTFVLWPAGFTHTHRGNPPLSNTKYIVTGWLEF